MIQTDARKIRESQLALVETPQFALRKALEKEREIGELMERIGQLRREMRVALQEAEMGLRAWAVQYPYWRQATAGMVAMAIALGLLLGAGPGEWVCRIVGR